MILYLCTEHAPTVSIRSESIRTIERTIPRVHGSSCLVIKTADGITHECNEVTDDRDIADDYTALHQGTL